jgi:hypothetical protein
MFRNAGRLLPKRNITKTTKRKLKTLHRYFRDSMNNLCKWKCGFCEKDIVFVCRVYYFLASYIRSRTRRYLQRTFTNQLSLRCCCLLKNKVQANLMNISIEHLL